MTSIRDRILMNKKPIIIGAVITSALIITTSLIICLTWPETEEVKDDVAKNVIGQFKQNVVRSKVRGEGNLPMQPPPNVAQGPGMPQEAGVAQGPGMPQEAGVAQGPGMPQEAGVAQGPGMPQEAGVAQGPGMPQEAGVAQGPGMPQEAGLAQEPIDNNLLFNAEKLESYMTPCIYVPELDRIGNYIVEDIITKESRIANHEREINFKKIDIIKEIRNGIAPHIPYNDVDINMIPFDIIRNWDDVEYPVNIYKYKNIYDRDVVRIYNIYGENYNFSEVEANNIKYTNENAIEKITILFLIKDLAVHLKLYLNSTKGCKSVEFKSKIEENYDLTMPPKNHFELVNKEDAIDMMNKSYVMTIGSEKFENPLFVKSFDDGIEVLRIPWPFTINKIDLGGNEIEIINNEYMEYIKVIGPDVEADDTRIIIKITNVNGNNRFIGKKKLILGFVRNFYNGEASNRFSVLESDDFAAFVVEPDE